MQILHTRDGTRMGNAIIIRQWGDTRDWPNPSGGGVKVIVPIWLCETDFGNQFKFTDREINDHFTRGEMQSYLQWSHERDRLRSKNEES